MRRLIAILWVVLCLVVAGPAFAAEKRVALVVGVSSYENAPALPNPLNDAVDMAAQLQAVGFEVVEAYDPDYAAMQRALRDFGRKLDGADVGLVFYAGHGVQVDGKNYLLPKDVTLADDGQVQREAVDVNAALQLLSANPRVSLVFLDACRDNPLAASLARRAGAARSLAVSQGLAQIQATASNTLVAYSTQPGAVAADGAGRNSPFTAALLKHVGTPGLDVQEMMRRVRRSVMDGTRGVQVPWDNSSLTSSFAFVPAPAGRAPPTEAAWIPPQRDPTPRQLDVALWNDVKDRSIAEIETYLKKYPNGVFAETARARVAALRAAATADRDRARTMAQDIAAEFARISGSGAIIAQPSTPLEFYANARLYELKGDFLNARRSYVSYLAGGLQYVDPHYRFQSFLKVQEGRAGAREVYLELTRGKTDVVSRYAASLLLPDEPRKAALEELVKANPTFAPAFYELAKDYSLEKLGTQTLAQKEREEGLLKTFVSLADAGKYLGWFIDQTVASEQLEDARRRVGVMGRATREAVSFSAMISNQGWTIQAEVAEMVEQMTFTLANGEKRDAVYFYKGTESSGGGVNLPSGAAPVEVAMSYKDASGVVRGPFRYRLEPARVVQEEDKKVLLSNRTSWVRLSPSAFEGKHHLYFTIANTSTCAIKELRYGLNVMSPNLIYRTPPCDLLEHGSTPSDWPNPIQVPSEVRFVSVEITFTDNTKSGVQRFELSRN